MPLTPAPTTPDEARAALHTVIDKNAEPFERIIAQCVLIGIDNLSAGVDQLMSLAAAQKEVNSTLTQLVIDSGQEIERLKEVVVALKHEIRDHDENATRHSSGSGNIVDIGSGTRPGQKP